MTTLYERYYLLPTLRSRYSRWAQNDYHRDKSESHFKAGDILRVGRFEDDQYFCTIEVLSVSPITLDELTEQHAAQENMSLVELREVIKTILSK